MHIEKNVCDKLFGKILDIDGKSDTSGNQSATYGGAQGVALYREGDHWMKPHASYTLYPDDGKKFSDFFKINKVSLWICFKFKEKRDRREE